MKNISCVLSTLVLSIGVLGCNDTSQHQTETQTKNTTSELNTETEASIIKEQTQKEPQSTLPDSAPLIHVVITGQDEPFGFKDEYGNVEGIDVDVIRAVGEAQGFRTDFATESRTNLLPSVGSGKYDVALAFLVSNSEREAKYGLSKPYFYAPNAILYNDASLDIKSIDDLTGLKVGVVTGASHEKELLAREDIGIKELNGEDTSFLLYQSLLQGKYDAIAYDKTILQYMINSNKDNPEGLVLAPYDKEVNPANAETVMAVAKDNSELLNMLNSGIDTIQQNGEMDRIVKKWLGEDAVNPLIRQ